LTLERGRACAHGPTAKRGVAGVVSPGECKSKSEEDAIMVREVETLKAKLRESGIERSNMKELLLRLLYVEMLGHDASFGYVPSQRHRTPSTLSPVCSYCLHDKVAAAGG
jgi:hypothetical protein